MERTALLTGSTGRVSELGRSLAGAGFALTAVDDPSRLPEVFAALGPASLDCYVQLPEDSHRQDPSSPLETSSHGSAPDGTAPAAPPASLDRAASVLPLLRQGGCAVLVATGETQGVEPAGRVDGREHPHPAPRGGDPDGHRIRPATDGGSDRWIGTDTRLVLLTGPCTTEDILRALGTGRPPRATTVASAPSDVSPDLSYSRWKEEILSASRYLWL